MLPRLLLKILFVDENPHTHSSVKAGHSLWVAGKESVPGSREGTDHVTVVGQSPVRPVLTELGVKLLLSHSLRVGAMDYDELEGMK